MLCNNQGLSRVLFTYGTDINPSTTLKRKEGAKRNKRGKEHLNLVDIREENLYPQIMVVTNLYP
jgi:hypothetical protein